MPPPIKEHIINTLSKASYLEGLLSAGTDDYTKKAYAQAQEIKSELRRMVDNYDKNGA